MRLAALAIALLAASGPAWGQGASTPPNAPTLERAAALLQVGAFEEAATMLRQILSVDPRNRRANEMLAFALESTGDLEGERRVRAALAAEFPDDPRIQADYGRVLERSGEEGEAIRAYRRAQELSAGGSGEELDAAIERMRGRTALEVGTPITVMSDPDATATRAQAAAAVPFGGRHHATLLATHYAADGKAGPSATSANALALSLVLRRGPVAYWSLGSHLQSTSQRGGAQREVGVGGVITGRAPFGPWLEAELRADVETPWDEAAVAVLHGGRTTGADGRVYCHGFSRRLLLQAGARRRQLSILAGDPQSTHRASARQSLWVAGADIVVWSKPGAAVRGEMLDEALIAPTSLSSALTLAYRHYDVTTRTAPDFDALIGLAPRGSVDEVSLATAVASPPGNLALELNAGLSRDSARQVGAWRAGGTVAWAPSPTTRLALAYEEATEVASGFVGRRRTGRLSFHVDL